MERLTIVKRLRGVVRRPVDWSSRSRWHPRDLRFWRRRRQRSSGRGGRDADLSHKGDCQSCHGWAADGEDGHPDAGRREPADDATRRAGIIATIKCGRPGKGMPAFDRLAYSDGRCNGMKAADLKRLARAARPAGDAAAPRDRDGRRFPRQGHREGADGSRQVHRILGVGRRGLHRVPEIGLAQTSFAKASAVAEALRRRRSTLRFTETRKADLYEVSSVVSVVKRLAAATI